MLPAENGFAPLFGSMYYYTGLPAGLPASVLLPSIQNAPLIVKQTLVLLGCLD